MELTACLSALDLAPGGAEAPDWVHLLPLGEFRGHDGRSFRLADAEGVIAASLRRGVDLVIDYEHQSEAAPEAKAGPIPAAGWIKALEARADGLWGKVEWTAAARELIGAKAYRYLSPVIRYSPQDRQVRRLCGAGLVHTPNLELTALAREEPAMTDTPAADPRLAAALALGLPESADGAAIQARVLDLLGRLNAFLTRAEAEAPGAAETEAPDPAEFAPIAAMRELLTERNTALATMSERAADKRVGEALAAGYITPAMRPWALALCREKPESFETFLSSSMPAYAHFLHPIIPTGKPPAASAAALSPEAQAICRQLDLDPEALGK